MKKIKKITLLFLKLFSSFCVAYVITFIGQELIAYNIFSFIFILLSVASGFFYLIKPYKLKGVLILNLILVGLTFLMRFYITAAYKFPV